MTHNDTLGENAMPAHSTSDDVLLDLYFNLGTRNLSESQLDSLYTKADAEDPHLALKILFYNRDPRGGRGERASFRHIAKGLTKSEGFKKLIPLIPEYGRWDDILELLDFEDTRQPTLELISHGIVSKDRLFAKWMPRKGRYARIIREAFEVTPRAWRKLLVQNSDTVEQKMCAQKWDEIDYSKVPSKAMALYARAFAKRSSERFAAWKAALAKGEADIKVKALYPHEIVKKVWSGDITYPVDAAWDKLLSLFPKHEARILPVCDVSGSMSGLPMEVSVSLGMFLSQLNTGPFKDVFCTFSGRPQLQVLKGTVSQRSYQLLHAQWDMNTDLEKVFKLILKAAEKASPEDVPSAILILSDMQFDQCITNAGNNAMEMIERMYEEKGIEVPKVIFWNLRAVVGTMPVKSDKSGAALVSGFSPAILSTIVEEGNLENFTPRSIMMASLASKRYDPIDEALNG